MTESAPDDPLVTADEVAGAAARIEGVAHRTPLESSTTVAELRGAASVHLKLENLQKTGAYKIRGAYNRISQLSPDERDRGVVAASGGNHAQGLAYAARAHDVDATVVMPEAAPASKVQATREYGAEVIIHGAQYQECYERALTLTEETGGVFVPPFNHRHIIAGQGTIGLELLDDLDEIDTVFAAIGGGGLVSGLATALKAENPDICVVGVQTEGAGHMAPSLAKGEIHQLDDVDTIAESIAASRTEPFTFRHVADRVDDVVEVTDAELTAAVALMAERAKQVVEPAGALPIAAMLSESVDVAGQHVVGVVSGGNLDLTEHAEWTQRGLVELGRYANLRVALQGWPGSLPTLIDAVEGAGGELDDIAHEPPGAGAPPNRHVVAIGVEVTGDDHRAAVIDAIEDASGLTVC